MRLRLVSAGGTRPTVCCAGGPVYPGHTGAECGTSPRTHTTRQPGHVDPCPNPLVFLSSEDTAAQSHPQSCCSLPAPVSVPSFSPQPSDGLYKNTNLTL